MFLSSSFVRLFVPPIQSHLLTFSVYRYGHINNSAYHLLADTIINTYLVSHCGLQPFLHPEPTNSTNSSTLPVSLPTAPPSTSPSTSINEPEITSVIGLIISSSAQYFAPTSFPSLMRCKLKVVKLGTSSVTYQIGIFEISSPSTSISTSSSGLKAAVITQATHVFVDRVTRRPVKKMPATLLNGLEKLEFKDSGSVENEKSKL